jgi:hypothetical protein
MRRLLLAATLLVLPAVARADGLPGTYGYPATSPVTYLGCIDRLACFTFDARAVAGDPYRGPNEGYGLIFENQRSLFFAGEGYFYATGHLQNSPSAECYLGLRGTITPWVVQTLPDVTGCRGGFDPTQLLPSQFTQTIVINGTTGYQVQFSTTPEPASVVLMASGLVGAFAVRRRRQAIA